MCCNFKNSVLSKVIASALCSVFYLAQVLRLFVRIVINVNIHHNNMAKTGVRHEKRMLIELNHLCSPGASTSKHHGKGPFQARSCSLNSKVNY